MSTSFPSLEHSRTIWLSGMATRWLMSLGAAIDATWGGRASRSHELVGKRREGAQRSQNWRALETRALRYGESEPSGEN